MGKKISPVGLNICQCPMARYNSRNTYHILYTKHYALYHLMLSYNNFGKVNVIVPILEIRNVNTREVE